MSRSRGIPAERLYPLLTGGYALLSSVILAVNLVYLTDTAGLNPLQLVMVGTVTEASRFVFEVPTGIVADAKSRKLSVLIGMTLLGVGFVWTGAFPAFGMILAAHVVIGIGNTFISGAQQAWIADEVGVEAVGRVYLRGVQTEQYGRLAGIPLGVALGIVALHWPLILGGVLLVAFAGFLSWAMTEEGFRPDSQPQPITAGMIGGGLLAATREVRGRPILVTLLVIMAFYGAASEGFGRLWVAHFYDDLGFPGVGNIEPVVWFGAMRMGVSLASLLAVRQMRLRVDTSSHRDLSRALTAINLLQIASLVVFALAGDFYVGVLAYGSAVVLSRVFDPLYLAWINQNVESNVRATVISMSSQMDALGQIGGGPVLGAIGLLASVKLAMLASAVAMMPVIGLHVRAFGQHPPLASEASQSAADD